MGSDGIQHLLASYLNETFIPGFTLGYHMWTRTYGVLCDPLRTRPLEKTSFDEETLFPLQLAYDGVFYTVPFLTRFFEEKYRRNVTINPRLHSCCVNHIWGTLECQENFRSKGLHSPNGGVARMALTMRG